MIRRCPQSFGHHQDDQEAQEHYLSVDLEDLGVLMMILSFLSNT